jgi:Ca2+-transporting ATPase
VSAFHHLFHNAWLWGALALSLALHFAVIYVPFLQKAFSTVSLTTADWLRCAAVASSVLWLREFSKLITRFLLSNARERRRSEGRGAIREHHHSARQG